MFKFIILLLILFISNSCSNISTKSERLDPDVVKYPEPRQRAYKKKFLKQDKTIFSNLFSKKNNVTQSLNFNVNPYLWKASVEILSKTIPLASVDSNSGIIITDWYNIKGKETERIKISVLVNTKELRADGVKVSVFKQVLKSNNWKNVNVNPKIGQKIERKIITKAGSMQLSDN